MKSVPFLSLYLAATVAAKESITNHGSIGFCRSPSLTSNALFPDLGVCSRDGSGLKDDEGAKLASRWTHSTPCIRNGTTEFCTFSDATFANNRGISVITTAERANYFLQQKGFTKPEVNKGVNQDLEQDRMPVYEVVHIPGKDMGVVAKKPLNRGDLIMSNTASIMVDYAAFEILSPADILKLQSVGLDYLPLKHRARLLNLSTHDQVEGYDKRVEKILSTNAFDIEIDDEEEDNFYVVFPEISRMNHDCRPNADYHFDPETMAQHIHAIRPIAAGEEITISYIDPLKSRKKRLAKLFNTWGFRCSCSLCTQPIEMGRQSDARIRQIKDLRNEFHDYTTESRATPQMAELFITLYELDRLTSMLYEAYTYAAIEYNGIGDPWTAIKYARLAVDHGLAAVGTRDPDVIEMQKLLQDPWTHWSWMLRTSKRMRWGKDQKAAKPLEESE